MRVSIDRSFERDTNRIHDKKLLKKVAACIELVIKSQSLTEIPNLKKLQGEKNYFRIKIGDYRAGLYIIGDEIKFERFLHRKEIYRYYP